MYRLWCLWSTVGRDPETSPTHHCCVISQRRPTSVYTSSAPTLCWDTSSPRHRETLLSHAGWGTYCINSHKGVMLAWIKIQNSSAPPTLQLPFCWHKHIDLLPFCSHIHPRWGQICLSSHRGNSFGRDCWVWLGQLLQTAALECGSSS